MILQGTAGQNAARLERVFDLDLERPEASMLAHRDAAPVRARPAVAFECRNGACRLLNDASSSLVRGGWTRAWASRTSIRSSWVAEVAEQRLVGLAHGRAGALALGVVGLGDVDGDQPRAWPVTICGVSWHDGDGSARKSKASPASGFSNLLTTGRPSRSRP